MRTEWTYKKLGEIATIKSGYTPSSSDLSNSGALPYFKVGDMNIAGNEKYLQHTSSFVNSTFKSYPPNSIVFPKNGAAIATNKKRILKRSSVVDLNTAILIPIQTANVEFLYYWICNIDFKDITRRGAVPTLDIKTLMQLEVPFPSLVEQDCIVAELNLLSGIIEKKREQLRAYDELAQSIFYDMFGDPIENPKRWEVKRIKEVCVSKSQIKRAAKCFALNEQIRYIDISSVDNSTNTITTTTPYIFSQAPSRAQQKVECGDILVSLVRPNLKNVAIVNNLEKNCVASSGFCILRTQKDVNSSFIFFIVKSDFFTNYLMQRVSGANYPAVKEDDIKVYALYVPPLSLQHEFAEKIQAIERQKALVQQSIAETQTMFDYTMDKYFE